jgi:hypothetical protein
MLAALSELSRTFSAPSSVITFEPRALGADCEDSVKTWNLYRSEVRRGQESGRGSKRNASKEESRSSSLRSAPTVYAKGSISGESFGRVCEKALEGRVRGGVLKGTEIAGGLEGVTLGGHFGGVSVEGGAEGEPIAGGPAEGLIAVGPKGGLFSGDMERGVASCSAVGGMTDFDKKHEPQKADQSRASRDVWDLNSREQAWVEAAQNQRDKSFFGTGLNGAQKEEHVMLLPLIRKGSLCSTAQGQGPRQMERRDFGMPMVPCRVLLPQKGVVNGTVTVESDVAVYEALMNRLEGKRPQEPRFQAAYLEGNHPQKGLMPEKISNGIEQSHEFERPVTGDLDPPSETPFLSLAAPGLHHAKSAEPCFAHFLPQMGTLTHDRGATGARAFSERAQDPGLYPVANDPLSKAAGTSLRVEHQIFPFEARYRSEEPVHGASVYWSGGQGSRYCELERYASLETGSRPGEQRVPRVPERYAPLKTGSRAPSVRFLLSSEAEAASLPGNASQPFPTGHMFQHDMRGEAIQERDLRMVHVPQAVREHFSMPPPLSLAEEMRSVSGEKRPTEHLQEGEVDSCFFSVSVLVLISQSDVVM